MVELLPNYPNTKKDYNLWFVPLPTADIQVPSPIQIIQLFNCWTSFNRNLFGLFIVNHLPQPKSLLHPFCQALDHLMGSLRVWELRYPVVQSPLEPSSQILGWLGAFGKRVSRQSRFYRDILGSGLIEFTLEPAKLHYTSCLDGVWIKMKKVWINPNNSHDSLNRSKLRPSQTPTNHPLKFFW